MNNSFLKHLSTSIFGATLIALGVTSAAPTTQALTLTGFTTCGGDMPGMQVKVGFLDGSSQTSTWGRTDSSACYDDGYYAYGYYGGGASGNGWSLTQSDNTFYSPWTFSASRSIASLLIDAGSGNTVFDIYPDLDGPRQTPGSADGKAFTVTSGRAPDSSGYYVPIQGAKEDLKGSLLLSWNNGFTGTMRFLADTDSGTGFDPVRVTQAPPQLPPPPAPPAPPPPPPPPNVAPTLSLSNYTINEGQSATVTLSATDPNLQDTITYLLNGNVIGTAANTSGSSSATANLGTFANQGTVPLAGQALDGKGGMSTANNTLTILNVPPTLTSFALNGNNSDITIDEGQSVSAALTATDPGLYDDISFFLNGGNIGTDPTDTTGTRAIATNLGTFTDDATVTYTANALDDGSVYSNPITRTITVKNVPPTLTGFDLLSNAIAQGQSAFANLFATDPGTDPITFSIKGPNGAIAATDATLSGTRSWLNTNLGLFNTPGTYTFTAQANDDDGGLSNIIEKMLTVTNVAPTITSLTAPLRIAKGDLFDFAATATDPGNDLLTYDWSFINNDSLKNFIGQSSKLSFDRSGFYDVSLKVSDPYGGVAYRTYRIESVPEPSSVWSLLAFGALGIGSLLKRKQSEEGKEQKKEI